MKATITYLKTGKQETITLDNSEGKAVRINQGGAIILETTSGIWVYTKDFVEKIELTF